MTVREQLAGQVGRIRSAWDRSPPAGSDFAVEGFRLESPSVVLPAALIRRFSCGVNSAAICGSPAGHLAITMFRWDRSRYPSKWDFPSADFPLIGAELVYCSISWDRYARRLDVSRVVDHRPRDFAELLDAWDAATCRPGPTPARAATWRDLPPML